MLKQESNPLIGAYFNFKETYFKKASLLLIVLPYLGFNWRELVLSPFYSVPAIATLLFTILIIELLFKLLLKLFTKQEVWLSVIISAILIVFFYGNYLVDPIFNLFHKNWGIIFRGKSIVFFLLALVIAMQYYIVVKRKNNYQYLNVFLILFSVVTFSFKHDPNEEHLKDILTIKNAYKPITTKGSKPVILIITDEYNSPNNLYRLTKDSSVFEFSSQLKKEGWQVKDSAYSYETSTINSVGSIFNFNLSHDASYAKMSMGTIGAKKLRHAALIDSINKKGISFINFGIFDMGTTKAYSQLYIYPKSFTEQFLLYSCYLFAMRSGKELNGKKGLGKNEIIMEHNKYFVYHLKDELKQVPHNSFVYVHLFMPHAPLQFEPEFKRKELKNLNDYVQYWHFCNTKLSGLLKELTQNNQYRIILTGDHGLRGMPTNPHATFTAYYGFDSTAIQKVKSVQDIGSLINGAF